MGVFFSFALAGAIAQFIDGTLGMGFGVTSSTVLIFLGATPVAASSSVYFATIGTSLSSRIAHWREGNVDKVILLRLALPQSTLTNNASYAFLMQSMKNSIVLYTIKTTHK